MEDTAGKIIRIAARIVLGIQTVMMLLVIVFACLLFNNYLTGNLLSHTSVIYGWGTISFLFVYIISFFVMKQVDKILDEMSGETEDTNDTLEDK